MKPGEIMLEKACQTNAVEAGRPTQQMNNGAGDLSQGPSHAVCKPGLSYRHPANAPLFCSKSSFGCFLRTLRQEKSGSARIEKDLNAVKK